MVVVEVGGAVRDVVIRNDSLRVHDDDCGQIHGDRRRGEL